MLREIRIKNLGIVDEVTVPFSQGLNVITGETGAGKSLLATAVSLLTGGRALGELVRTGAARAEVEAVFTPGGETRARLKELGLAAGEDAVAKRVIPKKGRSKTFLGGSPVPARALAEALGGLIGLFGQHAQRGLALPDSRLSLLDSFAGLESLAEEYRESFRGFRAAAQRVKEIKELSELSAQKRELIEFQVKEIRAAGLSPGEEEELLKERSVLRNLTALTEGAKDCLDILYEGEGSAGELIREARRRLEELLRMDDRLAPLLETLKRAGAEVEEAHFELRDYAQSLDPDPARLEEVEERIHLISRLKKKYGRSIEEILDFLAGAEEELGAAGGLSERLKHARAERERLLEDAKEKALRLSKKRRAAAQSLQKELGSSLGSLGLKDASFVVEIETPGEGTGESLTDTGLDSVEFLFSANPKEELRPVSIVASGGELSRLFLALMAAVAGARSPETLIFDEVDIGVGGKTARMVGEKLRLLAESRQVICITHLPQIASLGASHLLVEKVRKKNRNVVQVASLDSGERVDEIARMLAAGPITEESLAQARSLLGKA